jgi:hypothetical protein
MRRTTGAVLVGLGVFLLVVAPLMYFSLGPALLVAPLDQNITSRAVADDASYFDAQTLKPVTGVQIEAVREVRGDVEAGKAHVAVWDVYLTLREVGSPSDKYVKKVVDRVAFDRRTSEAVDGYNQAVDGASAKHEGVEYKFPFNTGKRSYLYYDYTALKAFPMEFRGVEQVGGLEAYKFVQDVPETTVGTPTNVPGDLVGQPGTPSVSVNQVYSNTRTVWVEPTSGVILRGEEALKLVYRAAGGQQFTGVDGLFKFDDKTISEAVDQAKKARTASTLLRGPGPVLVGVLGAVLLIIGILITLSARRAGGRRNRAQDQKRVTEKV